MYLSYNINVSPGRGRESGRRAGAISPLRQPDSWYHVVGFFFSAGVVLGSGPPHSFRPALPVSKMAVTEPAAKIAAGSHIDSDMADEKAEDWA